MNHTVRSVQRLVQLSPDVAKADQLLLAELGILDFVDALCAQLLKLRPEVSKMAPLLRGALDTFLAQRMPHSSSGGSLCRLLTPDKPLSRQISAEGSPKTEDRRLSWEGETRFWRRLGGQGEYQGGSRLRLLRMDALTRNWCCFFVDLKAGPSKARQYRSKQRQEPRAHEQPAHDDKCPLCKGREEATEVLRVWPDGRLEEREGLPEQEEDKTKWLVRVLRNPFPYLLTPQELYEKSFPGDRSKHAACFGDHDNHAANPDADHPLYRMVDGFGASEVVVESPTHNALIGIAEDNQVINTLRAMAARGRSLRKCQRVLQLMYFKQYGMEASGSLIHPHMQICSLPIVSRSLEQRLKDHKDFFDVHGCTGVHRLYVEDVIGGHAVSVARLVHQTEHFVASVPFAQVPRGRMIIAPKRHSPRFEDSTEEELKDLGRLLRLLLAGLYRFKDDPSYNLFWESAPTEHAFANREEERLTVEKSFCWTLHIRVPHKASGFGLASGVDVTRQLPEEEAKEMRTALLQEVAYPVRTVGFDAEQLNLEFPNTVGPFVMVKAQLVEAFNEFFTLPEASRPDPTSETSFMMGLQPCHIGLEEHDILFCHCSPLHPTTLSAASRAAAGIPKTANFFAWAYPVEKSKVPDLWHLSGPERAFLEYGGYVYYDKDCNVVGTTSISPTSVGTGLIFGGSLPLAEEVADALAKQGRFQEVTLEPLLRKGATHFAWVRPREFASTQCPSGAFAYKFDGGGEARPAELELVLQVLPRCRQTCVVRARAAAMS
ncbi:unnamed protein product [Effrenium voratum]|uniref:Galactose-1-phosphate uridylyltransferase n=1 Tax=Effrenium voratum TaxID=2562239 RepID=A0AA36HSD2_9DINO|nr:unnamed protein product [Effrenium voratum]